LILSGIAVITLTALIFNENIGINKSDKTYEFTLDNIEALASENSKSDFYCCGNSGTCATGPNFVIHGTLSTSPCK